MIKAFLFDYDGVITKGGENNRIFHTLAGNLGVSIEQTTEWLMEIWRPYLKGKLTQDEVWHHLETKYGKPIHPSQRDIWFRWDELKPLPDMIDLAISLKNEGFTAGVLSNAFKETEQIIQENGGYDVFDFKVVSCDLGYAKPDQEIFLMALEKLKGTKPHEVVFLDDREKNAETANQLGMIGIYVTNHVDAIKKIKELANLEGSSPSS